MDKVVGLPASRERGRSVESSEKDSESRSAKNILADIFAGKPEDVWDALPESLTNARDKAPERDAAKEGLKMAGQFAKVSTSNPLVHEFLDKRVVRITGPIDDAVAANVIAMMQLLEDLAPTQDIELRINSPGGSVSAGLAIYDAMKSLRCDVSTVCEGQAASMAAVLLAAGTPGKRSAMPHSRIMVHSVSVARISGDVQDIQIQACEMQRMQDIIAELLREHSGLDQASMKDLMNRDHFMSPGEAKALNLVDEVISLRHKPPFPRNAGVSPAKPLVPAA